MRLSIRKFSLPLFILSLFALISPSAWAHSMLQTAVLLDLHRDKVGAEIQLPLDRLSISFKQTVDANHYPAEKQALHDYVLAHVHPTDVSGRPYKVNFDSMALETVENSPYLVVHLTFIPPPRTSTEKFTLNYDVIAHEIVTHVVLVSIRSDDMNPIDAKDPILVGIIRGERKSLVVDRSKRS